MLAAEIEAAAVPLGLEARRFIDFHAADGIDRHGERALLWQPQDPLGCSAPDRTGSPSLILSGFNVAKLSRNSVWLVVRHANQAPRFSIHRVRRCFLRYVGGES